ncbi:probable inactive shikimate kinase like 1, chloroplastic [Vicia villosa]|uniref:probable inactive shikimate kinase like 1, chloroplastic n=1 Tax=Vicia villosa TaxID=3911 RepID=UPI00273BAEE8|nr:probable inactive shikimate kinase like 1, chloroplastic [Vicia villosa]
MTKVVFLHESMKSCLKTNLRKLLDDVLRYYYFDIDDLVEEAIGGASVAKSFKESDEACISDSKTEELKQFPSMGRLIMENEIVYTISLRGQKIGVFSLNASHEVALNVTKYRYVVDLYMKLNESFDNTENLDVDDNLKKTKIIYVLWVENSKAGVEINEINSTHAKLSKSVEDQVQALWQKKFAFDQEMEHAATNRRESSSGVKRLFGGNEK